MITCYYSIVPIVKKNKMESQNEFPVIPDEIKKIAASATKEIVSSSSKARYEREYTAFNAWRNQKGVKGVNEEIILAYVKEKSGMSAPSSLWTYVSMLKRMLQVKENIDIAKFGLVNEFLKKKSKNYVCKKSLVLNVDEIKKFLREAPNSTFLMIKVATIMGFFGGCRRDELYKMKFTDVEDKDSILIVKVPETKTTPRIFTVVDVENEISYLNLYRSYIALRPKHMNIEKLFIFYQSGKCRAQPVGLNSFSKMPMKIAAYLGLETPHLYTGHCFRRSSATSLANSGANMTTMKRHGGWRSTSVAEGYIADAIENKIDIAKKIGMGKKVDGPAETVTKESLHSVVDQSLQSVFVKLPVSGASFNSCVFNFNNSM